MEENFDDPNYVFEYDETAKCCLRWKNPKMKHLRGKECGTLTQNNQWAAQFRGMPRMAHRIIWEMFYDLDHKDTLRAKDGNYLNCKIENLDLEPFEDKNPQIELSNKEIGVRFLIILRELCIGKMIFGRGIIFKFLIERLGMKYIKLQIKTVTTEPKLVVTQNMN